jgi:ABC-type bacteriocin/lantibiotic exporter with double-glycine peptidase domain
VKVGLGQLRGLPLPAILHWDFNHFVVLDRVGRTKVLLTDPARGRRSLGLEEVGRHLTGVALVLSPTPSLSRRARTRPSLARYAGVFRESLPSLAQVLAASLALQIAGLALPVANQILVDRVIAPRQEAWLWGLGLALAAAVITRAILSLVRNFVVQGLQNALDMRLMGGFLSHLLRLPMAFFLQRDAGDLVQRVQSNATVRSLLGSQAVSALLDSVLLLSYAALMLAYDVRLGLLVLLFGLLRVILLLALRVRNQQAMATELAAGGQEVGALVEALTGLETTKASGAEPRIVRRWADRMVSRINASLDRRRVAIAAGQGMVFLQGAATASVFLVGGEEVIAQHMTMGVFVSFLVLQNLFMAPLESLLGVVAQLQFLGNHLQRLDDVLETAREPSGKTAPGRLMGGIELDKVSFGYAPEATPILQGITVRVRPGQKVAIVGPSGSGKSTLARLLLGMHLPTSGSIRFDGCELKELDLQKVRGQMGVVLQETFLFDDTVQANLCLGDEKLPLEKLRIAARAACMHDVIEGMPEGYATRVGENGSFLSGGQRQRLALARALATEPSILLLDEATSALDLETERQVHANLASLGCTRILIAHRLATVRDADHILVLHGGRILQEGTYEELVAGDNPLRLMAEASESLRA